MTQVWSGEIRSKYKPDHDFLFFDRSSRKMMPVRVVKMLEDENGMRWFATITLEALRRE